MRIEILPFCGPCCPSGRLRNPTHQKPQILHHDQTPSFTRRTVSLIDSSRLNEVQVVSLVITVQNAEIFSPSSERQRLIGGGGWPLASAHLQLDVMGSLQTDEKKALGHFLQILSDLLDGNCVRGIVPGKPSKFSNSVGCRKSDPLPVNELWRSLPSCRINMKRIHHQLCGLNYCWRRRQYSTQVHHSLKSHLFEPQCSHSAEFMEPDLDKQSWLPVHDLS